jgi:hypothetical protein
MRILFLRLLIASWMVPMTWSLVFIIDYLVFGWDETIGLCKSLTDVFWYGRIE